MKKIILYILLIVVLFVVAFPTAIEAYYSVAGADDFSHAVQSGGVIEAVRSANYFYMSWGGGWPFNFLSFLLHPLKYAEAYSDVMGVFLVTTYVIFIITLLVFNYILLKYIIRDISFPIVLILGILLLFGITNSDVYFEIFSWYVGNTYLWEVVISICAVVLCIKCFEGDLKIPLLFFSALVGFVAGFAYIFDISLGVLYILLLARTYMNNKRVEIRRTIPLFCMIIGGCLSVFAPGNFNRANAINAQGVGIVEIILISAKSSAVRFLHMFRTSYFLIILIIFFGVGMIKYNRYAVKKLFNPIIIWLCGYASTFGVLFPLFYGYGYEYIPNRMRFCVYLVVIIWSCYGAFYSGCWLNSNFAILNNFKRKRLSVIICAVLCLLVIGLHDIRYGFIFKRLPSYGIVIQIDDIKSENNYYKGIFREVAESKSDNVIVHRTADAVPRTTNIIYTPQLSDDNDSWFNGVVAAYYGKNSFVLKVEN